MFVKLKGVPTYLSKFVRRPRFGQLVTCNNFNVADDKTGALHTDTAAGSLHLSCGLLLFLLVLWQ